MIKLEKKRRIKLWGRINLFETSCVGLPMYPAAHKSFSLIKALTETDLSPEEPSDQLNIKEDQMPEEENKVDAPEGEAEAKPEEETESAPEEGAEKPEEGAEDAKPEEETTEKAISVESMTDVLAKALTKAINEAEVKSGLVSPEQKVEKMQEILKKKSLGELAVMQGLFKVDPGIGNPVEIK